MYFILYESNVMCKMYHTDALLTHIIYEYAVYTLVNLWVRINFIHFILSTRTIYSPHSYKAHGLSTEGFENIGVPPSVLPLLGCTDT